MQFVSSMLSCCHHVGQKQHHSKISNWMQCPCWCPSTVATGWLLFFNVYKWCCLPRPHSLPTCCHSVIDAEATSLHCCFLHFLSLLCTGFTVTAHCAMLQCCQCSRCCFTFAPDICHFSCDHLPHCSTVFPNTDDWCHLKLLLIVYVHLLPLLPHPPPSSLPSDDWGDLLIHGLWSHGTVLTVFALDVQIIDTNAKTYQSKDPLKVLASHEKAKKKKYLAPCLTQRCHFTPFIVSADGLLGR